MTASADALWQDLGAAIHRRIERRSRRRRTRRLGAVTVLAVGVLASGAIASGIASDLDLAPGEWAVLRGGRVDDGRGAYVHATRIADGSASTFMVEHDDGLEPYQAFLLHERTVAAAAATSPVPVRREPGELCTAEQLTRAERIALGALSARFEAGTAFAATGTAVSHALAAGFDGTQACRGLSFAGEQARLVFAGSEPRVKLMPGAR
jgi:hypothetical protein